MASSKINKNSDSLYSLIELMMSKKSPRNYNYLMYLVSCYIRNCNKGKDSKNLSNSKIKINSYLCVLMSPPED